jgi:uncharacterized protein YndB with AHSA1/START domain
MKWALGIAGAVASVVLVVVVVGLLLPQHHEATRSAHIDAPPDRVWAVLMDVSAYPSWRRDVRRVETLPNVAGGRAWREYQSDRSNDRGIAFEMREASPPRHLVTRITDRSLPFGGEWEYDIVSEGSGSRVTIAEHGEIYNPVFRFVSRFVLGYTSTVDAYLASLGRKWSAGASQVSGAESRA